MSTADPYGRDIFAHDPHRDGPGARRPRSVAVHVEIGMDGKKTVSALSGSALELSAAAARILNIFYAAFCQRGIGEEFKETMRYCVNREDSPVWRKELAE